MEVQIPDVHPIQPDAALGHLVEAGHQVDEGALAGAGGADEGHRLARLDIQVDVLQHVAFRVPVFEGDVVEFDVAFGPAGQLLEAVPVTDGGLTLQHFLHTAGRHQGAGQHDEHLRDHQEGHDDLHNVLHVGHHIAHGHVEPCHQVAAHPDDEQGHCGEHEVLDGVQGGHGTLHVQTGFRDVLIGDVEALLLQLFVAEGPDDQHAGEALAGHQVQAVRELLHDLELGYHQLEGDHLQRQEQHHGDGHDPAHVGAFPEGHDDAAHGVEGGHEHHADAHHGHLLHLLHVVGASGDEGGAAESVDVLAGEAGDAGVNVMPQLLADARADSGAAEAVAHGAEAAHQAEQQHDAADLQDVALLGFGYVAAHGSVDTLGEGDGHAGHEAGNRFLRHGAGACDGAVAHRGCLGQHFIRGHFAEVGAAQAHVEDEVRFADRRVEGRQRLLVHCVSDISALGGKGRVSLQRFAPRLACIHPAVRIFHRRLIRSVKEPEGQIHHVRVHGFGGGVGNAALHDAHVHDAAHVVRQIEFQDRLREQQEQGEHNQGDEGLQVSQNQFQASFLPFFFIFISFFTRLIRPPSPCGRRPGSWPPSWGAPSGR